MKAMKVAAMVLLTVLVVFATLTVASAMFNGAGWLGFFGAPVIGFLTVVWLVWSWKVFLKRVFNLGG